MEFLSAYVAGGGTRVHPGFVSQPSITLGLNPLGIYGQFWLSYSPWDANDDCGDERDYTLGIFRIFYGWSFDLSYSYYNLYRLGKTNGDLHAFVFYVESPPIFSKSLTAYFKLDDNIPTDKNTLEGGVIYTLGLKYALPFPEFLPGFLSERFFNIDVCIKGHDGIYGKELDYLSLARLKIYANFDVWRLVVTPAINLQKGLENIGEGGTAEDEFWGGIKFSYSFSIF